jgi:hypothetical protein
VELMAVLGQLELGGVMGVVVLLVDVGEMEVKVGMVMQLVI